MVDTLGVRIRTATESDLDALEWDGKYAHFRRVYRQALREAQRDRRMIFVAEATDQVVGQLFVHLHSIWKSSFGGARTGYFHSFRVKPHFRNQGIGSRLLWTAEAALVDRNYANAVISVAKANLRAQQLYRQHGYSVYSEDPGEWSYVDHRGRLRHISEPAYVMVKALRYGNAPRD
ncbi:MAG: GNAT family N-acetyltransferase [Anaerolineales bacterium]|nr:GNAT family N-acetyltransferase [Anaerolineales bacterium]